jgi:hypothetical protein
MRAGGPEDLNTFLRSRCFLRSCVRPKAAYYHSKLREFILPYDAVRTADQPDNVLLDFLQSTYEAAADYSLLI